MCSKCNGRTGCDCIKGTGVMEGEGTALCSCYVDRVRSDSGLSAVDSACETYGPNFVYKRRNLRSSPAAVVLPHVSMKKTPVCEGRVYWRRKHYNPVVVLAEVSAKKTSVCDGRVYRRRKHYTPVIICPTGVLENVSPDADLSGAHASSPRSENPCLAIEKQAEHEALHTMEGVRSSMSAEFCSNEPVLTHSGAIDECFAEQHVSDLKGKGDKNVELHSVDDSCSSSMINTDTHSASLKVRVDENGECSSSGAFVRELMGEDISVKDLCISILKSHGLLSRLLPKIPDTCVEDIASCSGVRNSCQCNVCGLPGITENMLICDQCEEAFHVPCCNPTMRMISYDEWFCQYCLKKRHKIMKATAGSRSTIIRSDSSFRPATSKSKISPIALMLKDSEPYTTGVRIGKDFQAVVPCWSGQITGGIDVRDQPMELDPPHVCNFHILSSEQLCKPNPIGNWLQCQDVIVGAGEIDGTVCGKWRRAPLFEVQTENWDCFSSVLWDPTHADCAAPQELETGEILKQLKYIETLRPRLEAKKRKLDAAETNESAKPDAG